MIVISAIRKSILALLIVVFGVVGTVHAQYGLTMEANEFATIPGSADYDLGTSPFTIEAIINISPGTTFRTIFSSRSPGNIDNGILFATDDNGVNALLLQTQGTSVVGNVYLNVGSVNIYDGKCHAVAVVREANHDIKLYVDGLLVDTKTQTVSSDILRTNASDPIYLGSDKGIDHYLNGSIREFRMWSVARTATEINDYHNQSLPVDQLDLVSYYKIDEGSGETLTDQVAIPNHAYLGSVNTADANDPEWDVPCGCVVTNTNSSGLGSFYEAVACANADPDLTTITFDISGDGIHEIINDYEGFVFSAPVIIDGRTEDGEIILTSTVSPGYAGLEFDDHVGRSEIYDLKISEFDHGVRAYSDELLLDDITLEENQIGIRIGSYNKFIDVEINNCKIKSNAQYGIHVLHYVKNYNLTVSNSFIEDNVNWGIVAGYTAGDIHITDNLIMGNGTGASVHSISPNSSFSGNTVSGNIDSGFRGVIAQITGNNFGLSIDETEKLSNQVGLSIKPKVFVGDEIVPVITDNVISGNKFRGSEVGRPAIITNNFIGVNRSFDLLGNVSDGLHCYSSGIVVGTEEVSSANYIGGNGGHGLSVEGDLVTISKTIFRNNTGKGINLNGSGNINYQAPDVTDMAHELTSEGLKISGEAISGDVIELFYNGDDASEQQALQYVTDAITNASGEWEIVLPSGDFYNTDIKNYYVATATDGNGNTSELSTPYLVEYPDVVGEAGLAFNGGQFVSLPGIEGFDLEANPFTLEATVNIQPGSSRGTIFSSRPVGLEEGLLVMAWSSSQLLIQVQGAGAAGNVFANVGQNYFDGECHTLGIVREANNTITVYLDGANVYTRALSASKTITRPSADIPAYIGADRASGEYFTGLIKEVRLWNVARSASEIDAFRLVGLDGAEADLLGYWKLDQGAGEIVKDYAVTGNDGVLGAVESNTLKNPTWQGLGCGCIVTNTNDSGPGSLIAAVECANTTFGVTSVVFDIPETGTKNNLGQYVFTLRETLHITEDIIIDASSLTNVTTDNRPKALISMFNAGGFIPQDFTAESVIYLTGNASLSNIEVTSPTSSFGGSSPSLLTAILIAEDNLTLDLENCYFYDNKESISTSQTETLFVEGLEINASNVVFDRTQSSYLSLNVSDAILNLTNVSNIGNGSDLGFRMSFGNSSIVNVENSNFEYTTVLAIDNTILNIENSIVSLRYGGFSAGDNSQIALDNSSMTASGSWDFILGNNSKLDLLNESSIGGIGELSMGPNSEVFLDKSEFVSSNSSMDFILGNNSKLDVLNESSMKGVSNIELGNECEMTLLNSNLNNFGGNASFEAGANSKLVIADNSSVIGVSLNLAGLCEVNIASSVFSSAGSASLFGLTSGLTSIINIENSSFEGFGINSGDFAAVSIHDSQFNSTSGQSAEFITVGQSSNLNFTDNSFSDYFSGSGKEYYISSETNSVLNIIGNEFNTSNSLASDFSFIKATAPAGAVISNNSFNDNSEKTSAYYGVTLSGGANNQITENIFISDNAFFKGISLLNGANNSKQTPTIISAKVIEGGLVQITGVTQTIGDVVELFGHDGIAVNANEHLGTVTTTSSTNWSMTIPESEYTFFVATSTDIEGNTSEISAPFEVQDYEQAGLLFSGNEYVTIPGATAYELGTGPFTLETTIKLDPSSNTRGAIYSSRTGENGMLLMCYSDETFLVQLGGHSGSNKIFDIGYDYFDGICHTIAVVRENVPSQNDIIHFYFDGKEISTVSHTPKNVTVSGSPIYIGQDTPSSSTASPLEAAISEVRLWNIARTDAQIASFHKIELFGTEPGLIGYWKLNEGGGEVAADFSPTGNDAYLGNSIVTIDHNPVWGEVTCASDAVCVVRNTAESGDGSFTAAVDCANDKDEHAYIVFAIDEPKDDELPYVIPGSYWSLTNPGGVSIDGATQAASGISDDENQEIVFEKGVSGGLFSIESSNNEFLAFTAQGLLFNFRSPYSQGEAQPATYSNTVFKKLQLKSTPITGTSGVIDYLAVKIEDCHFEYDETLYTSLINFRNAEGISVINSEITFAGTESEMNSDGGIHFFNSNNILIEKVKIETGFGTPLFLGNCNDVMISDCSLDPTSFLENFTLYGSSSSSIRFSRTTMSVGNNSANDVIYYDNTTTIARPVVTGLVNTDNATLPFQLTGTLVDPSAIIEIFASRGNEKNVSEYLGLGVIDPINNTWYFDLSSNFNYEEIKGFRATATIGNQTSEFSVPFILSAQCPVTITDDHGVGSLRSAIDCANNNVFDNPTIVFNISGTGEQVINLDSDLPMITKSTLVDGTTQALFSSGTSVTVFGGDGLPEWYSAFTVGVSDVTIQGLKFNQVKSALSAIGENDSEFSNITFSGNEVSESVEAVYFEECSDIEVQNNSFNESSSASVSIRFSEGGLNVTNNTIDGGTGDGVKIVASTLTSTEGINDNYIENIDGTAIELDNSTIAGGVNSNTINDVGEYGVSLLNGASVDLVSFNTISSTTLSGVYAVNSSFLEDSGLRENTISNAGEYGVSLVNMDDNSTLFNNTITVSRLDGIHIQESEYCYIDQNKIGDNGASGVSVSLCQFIYVTNNQIGEVDGIALPNRESGILFDQVDQSQAVGNRIANNGAHGVSINSALNYATLTEGNLMITGNSISTNRKLGIQAHQGAFLTVSDNQLDQNTEGIGLIESEQIDIENNSVTGSRGDGLVIEGSNSVRVKSNDIQRNGENGIYSFESQLTIGGNEGEGNAIVLNNGSGVYVDEASSVALINNFIGTDIDYTSGLGNEGYGIYASTTGALSIEFNTIGSNTRSGIYLSEEVDASIYSNWIGTNPTHSINLGNQSHGIESYGAGDFIGALGQGNVIAYNDLSGVYIESSDSYTARQNKISTSLFFHNGAKAIDLNLTSAYPVNDQKIAPVFLDGGYVTTSGINLIVQAEVGDVVEIFTGDGQEGNAFGFVQKVIVTSVPQSILLPGVSDFYLATATDVNNNTSEFSMVFDASDLPVICPVTDTRDAVTGSLRDAIETCVNVIDRKAIVDFRLQTPGPYNLFLDNNLPAIQNIHGVTIDGNSQVTNNLGSGPQEVIIDGANLVTSVFNIQGGINHSISNLSIANATVEGLVIESDHTTIDNLTISNVETGIEITGAASENITVQNSTILNVKYAITVNADAVVSNSTFTENVFSYTHRALRIHGLTNSLINSNYFNTDENATDLSLSTAAGGVEFTSSFASSLASSNVIVRDNFFGRNYTGIRLYGVPDKVHQDIEIIDNQFGEVNGTAVEFVGGQGRAFHLEETNNTHVTGNHVIGIFNHGIYADNANDGVKITSNVFESEDIKTGVYMSGRFGGGAEIIGNLLDVKLIGLDMLSVHGSAIAVKENIFKNSEVGLDLHDGLELAIINNEFSDHSNRAITVQELKESSRISGNVIRNSGVGIYSEGLIHSSEISNNQLIDNDNGIYTNCDGTGTHALFEGNVITSSNNTGIAFEMNSAENIVVRNNTLIGEADNYLKVIGGWNNTIELNKIGVDAEGIVYTPTTRSVDIEDTDTLTFNNNTVVSGSDLMRIVGSDDIVASGNSFSAPNGLLIDASNRIAFNDNAFDIETAPVQVATSNEVKLSNNVIVGHTENLAINLSLESSTGVSNGGIQAPEINTITYTTEFVTLSGTFSENGEIEVFVSHTDAEQPYKRVVVAPNVVGTNWVANVAIADLDLVDGKAYLLATGTKQGTVTDFNDQNGSTSQFSELISFCPTCTCTVDKNYLGTQTGTLDESIRKANRAECGIIDFAITPNNDGPNDIWINEALPEIQNPILIDGTTEAINYDPSTTPLVHLRASGGGNFSGLTVNTDGVEIKGLQLSGFVNNVVLNGNDNKLVATTFKYQRGSSPYDGHNLKITGDNNEVIDNYFNEVPEGTAVGVGFVGSEGIRIEGNDNKIGIIGHGNAIQGSKNAAIFIGAGFAGNEMLDNQITHQSSSVGQDYKAIELEEDANNTKASPIVNFGFEEFDAYVRVTGQGSQSGEIIQLFTSTTAGQQAIALVNTGEVLVDGDLNWQADIPRSYVPENENHFFVAIATSQDGTSELSDPFIIGNEPIQCKVTNGNISGEGSFSEAVMCTNGAGEFFALPADIVFELPNQSYWVSSPTTHVFTNQYGTYIDPGTVTFNLSGSNNAGIILDNVSNWSMKNMSLSSFENTISGSGQTISLTGNTFRNTQQGKVIELDALGSNYTITDNEFKSGKDVLTLSNGDFVITDNNFGDGGSIGGYGIHLSNTTSTQIVDNTFKYLNGNSSIYVDANGGVLTVEGNTFTQGKQSMNLIDGDFTVTNNRSLDTVKGYVIRLEEAHGSQVNNNNIFGASIDGDYPGHGIIVSKSHDVELHDNVFGSFTQNWPIKGAAIYLTGTSFENPVDTEFETFNVSIYNNDFYSGTNAVFSLQANIVLIENNNGTYSSEDMYVVDGGTENTLSKNVALPVGDAFGIKHVSGGNNNHPVPVLEYFTTFENKLRMGGTSEPGTIIELFKGVISETAPKVAVPHRASKYLSSTITNKGDGDIKNQWEVIIDLTDLLENGETLADLKLYSFVATSTDDLGNTSELSIPFPIDLRSCIVRNTNDAGDESLRGAIEASNNGECPLISFNIDEDAAPNVIRLLSPLPSPTVDNMIIDGSFEPGYVKDARPEIQITYDNAASQLVGFEVSNVSNFSIHGIDFEGFDTGIKLSDVPFVDISFNTITEPTTIGIDVVNTSAHVDRYNIDTNTIISSNFQMDHGIRIDKGLNAQLRGNNVDGYKVSGIKLNDTQEAFISGNGLNNYGSEGLLTVEANSSIGIQLVNTADSELKQNNVLNSNVGISLHSSLNNEIHYNALGGVNQDKGTFDSETGQYIPEGYSYDTETEELRNLDGVLIKDANGYITDSEGDPIEIVGPTSSIAPVFLAGIQLTSTSENNKVASNVVRNSLNWGVNVSGSNNNSLRSNYVSTIEGIGLRIENSNDATLDSNRVSEVKGQAIYLLTSNSCSVIANKILDNQSHGIYLDEADENTLIGNYIGTLDGINAKANMRSGIMLVNNSDYNIIGSVGQDNIIAFNEESGVVVASGSVGNQISYNNIYANGISDDGTRANAKAIELVVGATSALNGNSLNAAPVITGSINTDATITVTGTGDNGEIIHLYVSDGLPQNAIECVGNATVSNGVWEIPLNEEELDLEHSLYVVATSTDVAGSTSELSDMKAVGTCYVTNEEDNGDDTYPIIGSMRDGVRCVNDQTNNANLFFNIKGQSEKTIELIEHLPALYNPGGVTMNGINIENRPYDYISTVNISQSKEEPGTTPLLRLAPELGPSTIDSLSFKNSAYGLEIANDGTVASAIKIRPGKEGGSEVIVTDNVAEEIVPLVGIYGVQFVGTSANSTLKNSSIEGFATSVVITGTVGPIVVENNDLHYSDNAVTITDEANEVNIINNRIDTARIAGVKVSGVHNKTTVISGNTIGKVLHDDSGIGYADIWLDQSAGVTVADNTLYPALGLETLLLAGDDYEKHGVLISSESSGHNIEGNTFNTTDSLPGVYTVPNADPTIYSNITIEGNTFNTTGIEISGVNHSIVGNTITSGTIDVIDGTGVLVSLNAVQTYEDNAIDLVRSTFTRMSGNTINGLANLDPDADPALGVNAQEIRAITINRGLIHESNVGKLAPIIDSAAFLTDAATCESMLLVYGNNAEANDIVEVFYSNEEYPDAIKYLGATTADDDGLWVFDVPFEHWLLPTVAENYAFTATATRVTPIDATTNAYETSDLSDVMIVPNEVLVKVVINTNNDGVGSLRDAVNFINCSDFYIEVHFAFEIEGPHVIELSEPLPSVYNPSGFKIDGYDYTAKEGQVWTERDIIVDGSLISSAIDAADVDKQFTGFEIEAGSVAGELRKLAFKNFYTGVKVNNPGNTLEELVITNTSDAIIDVERLVGEYGVVFENEVAGSNSLIGSVIVSTEQAIVVGELNEDIIVTENVVESADVGVTVSSGVANSLFDFNTIGDARIGFSINGVGDADPIEGQSNRFYNNILGANSKGEQAAIHEYGFFMEDTYQALVDSNKIWSISGATGAAIYLNTGEYNSISSNLIGYAVESEDEIIDYSVPNGIQLSGASFNRYNIVVANEIHNYTSVGIQMTGTSGNTVSANKLVQTNSTATSDKGIWVENSENDLLQFNEIVDYKGEGIDLRSSSSIRMRANQVYSVDTDKKGINLHINDEIESNDGLPNPGINGHSYDQFDRLVLQGAGLIAGDIVEVFAAPRDVAQASVFHGRVTVASNGTWSYTLSQAFGTFGINYFVTTVTRDEETSEFSSTYIVNDWLCQLDKRVLPFNEDYCAGSYVELVADIEGVNYTWTRIENENGEAVNEVLSELGPSLEVSLPGKYQMTASAGVCNKVEEVTVTELPAAEDPFFTAATELYLGETLVVVDIQESRVDEIRWDFNEAFELEIPVEDQASLPGYEDDLYHYLTYPEEGEYKIFKYVINGKCASTLVKPVYVIDGVNPNQEEGDITAIDVSVLEVIPNPSEGQFTVTIDLSEQSEFILFVTNVGTATKVYQKRYEASFVPTSIDGNGAHYSFDFDWPAMSAGTYVIGVTDGVIQETTPLIIVK